MAEQQQQQQEKIEYLFKEVAHLKIKQKSLDIENAVLETKVSLLEKENAKKGDEIFTANTEIYKLRQELIHKKRDYETVFQQYEHASKCASELSERYQKDQAYIQSVINKRLKAREAYRTIVNSCGDTKHKPDLHDALEILRESLKDSSN